MTSSRGSSPATVTPLSVELRLATRDERAVVGELWEEAGFPRVTDDEWNALFDASGSAVLLATSKGQVVGAAVASFDGWRAYVYHVAVDASVRHRGVGQALVGEAERQLAAAGARNVFAAVHEENRAGMALVAGRGYLPEGELVFVKRLSV